ncbi:hypothetical protein [Streptomyces sp. SID9913]|nr:hypothetical protein [Streptomyces sp. SID9913]
MYSWLDSPAHGGHMVTYPVRVFLLQPFQYGPWAPQRHSRA